MKSVALIVEDSLCEIEKNIREAFEERENAFLSSKGCKSSRSKGRLAEEPLNPIRTVFEQDRDRIVYSNSFRRLKHKTQVFLSPFGAHYRTRLTHTLEVAQISRTISRALRLNEDLTEAIALGHDLGHTPFGHSGETALKEIYSSTFSHNEQSLRVVDIIENNGRGLNLTVEVRDGILKHSKGYGKIIPDDASEMAMTYEGRIVRIADIMAYLNHDLDDAIRSGVITRNQIPELCVKHLGKSHSERADAMIRDVIRESGKPDGDIDLNMSSEIYDAMTLLRKFLYHNVYRSDKVHGEFVKAKKILTELYEFFLDDVNEERLIKELKSMDMGALFDRFMGNGLISQGASTEFTRERIVCDMIASLTDNRAMDLYRTIFFPKPMV